MAIMPPTLAEGVCELLAYLWLSEGRESEPQAPAPLAPPGRSSGQTAAGQQQGQQPQRPKQSVQAIRIKAMMLY